MAIVARRDFIDSLQPLKALRESQGLRVALVDIEDVYDEFSFGQRVPQALKDFLRWTQTQWTTKPRFVLLAGNASYDPRDYFGLGPSDFVPTKLVDAGLLETASDDWFVDFEGDGLPDVSIGRLPARTPAGAATMVSKIVAYERGGGGTGALLVSDRNDSYDFEGASARVRRQLPAGMSVDEIRRSQGDDATVRSALLGALNAGKRVVNWTGHGSVDLWRGEILTAADATDLANESDLSFFTLMTCLNGYSVDPALPSLAEALLAAPRGGAVAAWASSGLTAPDGQVAIDEELYRLLSLDASLSLGAAARRAKAATSDTNVRRTWILFGDPATRLR